MNDTLGNYPDNRPRVRNVIRLELFSKLDELSKLPDSDVPVYFYPMIKSYINHGAIPEAHLDVLAKQFVGNGEACGKSDAMKFFDDLFTICRAERLELPIDDKSRIR